MFCLKGTRSYAQLNGRLYYFIEQTYLVKKNTPCENSKGYRTFLAIHWIGKHFMLFESKIAIIR